MLLLCIIIQHIFDYYYTSLKDGIAFQHVLNSHDPEKEEEKILIKRGDDVSDRA